MSSGEGITRRGFIGGAGVAGAGVAATTLLAGPSVAQAQTPPSPAVPWAIPRLDPIAIRDDGYWGYWANDPFRKTTYGCCYGVAYALIRAIRNGLGAGSPWDWLPLEIFKWGKGGVVDTGNLCGALGGALPIFNLVAPAAVFEMGNDLIRWYSETALPSMEMDGLDSKRPFPKQAQSVAGSALCHISVTNWCKASGAGSASTARKVRCGKLTGDVAKMAATILNRLGPGLSYTPLYPTLPSSYEQCVRCHIDAPPPPTPTSVRLNNTQGITNCMPCHPGAAPVMGKK